jgi:medium-chain acyl-[acyl-carrier-protein] hydrolase
MRFRPNDGARARFLCFHHAGGGASAFRPWVGELSDKLDLCAVQLPGRESRLRETPFTRLEDMVPAVAHAIQPVLDRPFVFFGHSLGAMVAFEVARELARRGGPGPIHLFVSGRRGPTRPDRGPRLSHLIGDAFVEEVRKRWDGIPAPVLEEPELLELLLPTLRADLSVVESYEYVPGPALECAITALGGTEDPSAEATDLAAWRDHTRSAFSMRMFPGGHFFVQTARSEVLAAVRSDLASVIQRLGIR